jgi:hypothetical protein
MKPGNKKLISEASMGDLEKRTSEEKGIQSLMMYHKRSFRIPENINYYSEKDFKAAEKKYLKHCLSNGGATLTSGSSKTGAKR